MALTAHDMSDMGRLAQLAMNPKSGASREEIYLAVASLYRIQGAGLNQRERELMRDLIQRIGFPAIIASRTTLGTINHTLLTLAALRNAKLPVCGVVLIGKENIENRRAIEHFGNVQVIGDIPILENIDRAALLGVFEKYFDRQAFQ